MSQAISNIFLIGFMATGKTTVGRLLAEQMNMTFVDLDARIAAAESLSIAEIFRQKGEGYFRDAEQRAVAAVAAETGCVVACGGGVVVRPDNLPALRRSGTVICLAARPEIIISRVGTNRDRPLLNVPDPVSAIRQLLQQRQPLYDQADVTIDTSGLTPEAVVEQIRKELP